jgi:transcriptional regulator with XRE-family HTH domain
MINDDPTPLIARRLKDERTRRSWTLDEMARRTRVSKAMLSKLERCEASPTAALLGRISGALGMTLSTLLAAGEQRGARLVRAHDQGTWIDPQTSYVRRQVSPLMTELPVQLVEVALPPGAEVAFPASAYAFIGQFIWMLTGALEFTEGAIIHRLGKGDCLELGAPADCVFRNRTGRTCRYLVVVVRR